MSGIDRADAAHPDAHAGDYEGTELVATAHAKNYNRWILDFLRPHVGRVVVEVGAGRGNFTRALLSLGAERVVAIEPSRLLFPKLRELASADARVDARLGTLGDSGGDLAGSVDSVAYINVLEHIEDDRDELVRAHALLRPGGTLLVFVPALPWLGSHFDESVGHHRRYRRRQLAELVRSAGFDVVDVRWFDMLGVLTWLVAFRLLRMDMNKGPVIAYDRLAVPVARAIDRLTGPPLGKSLLLVGRRSG